MKNLYIPLTLCSIVLALGAYIFFTSNTQKQVITVSDQKTNSDQTYTLSDIATHSTASDCWMTINGRVYDVTSYIVQHPDGKSILQGCGKDATRMYEEVRKHAREAMELLPAYEIGTTE